MWCRGTIKTLPPTKPGSWLTQFRQVAPAASRQLAQSLPRFPAGCGQSPPRFPAGCRSSAEISDGLSKVSGKLPAADPELPELASSGLYCSTSVIKKRGLNCPVQAVQGQLAGILPGGMRCLPSHLYGAGSTAPAACREFPVACPGLPGTAYCY